MTQYKTRDGQEIKVGGVYLTPKGNSFECLGFKKGNYETPIVGILYRKMQGGDVEEAAGYSSDCLTSLPESQPEYDPEQMWVLYVETLYGIKELSRDFDKRNLDQMVKNGLHSFKPFAIAPVGKKFRKGDNL